MQIVAELDRYIIGQSEAKKCVAIALRNRYRRKQLPPELRDEVAPKNIIMIGPTGVGKTEIARRLAKLVKAPFVKVEATKYTEVGYVGRDVDSMVRDLVETAVRMVRQEKRGHVAVQAQRLAEERILMLLAPSPSSEKSRNPWELIFGGKGSERESMREDEVMQQRFQGTEEKRAVLREKMSRGELESEYVEVEVEERTLPILEIFPGAGMEEMGVNLQDFLGELLPRRKRKRRVTVKEARKILTQEEADKLIDGDEVISEAIERAESSGIIFLDEIDKIAAKEGGYGPDVSRGGVQRDILPLVEGSTVVTRYGPVKTDHILFIAAGAFHAAKPADLIPELQGRFPLRVELQSLGKEDFRRILTEPQNSLIKQYTALLATEGVNLTFTPEAITEIAEIAYQVNNQMEDIGARRLYTILERLLQDLLFAAPDAAPAQVEIDRDYVRRQLTAVIQSQDLGRYIL